MILLDTHVWLWWLTETGQLSVKQRDELDRLASKKELALSWVSVWETELLHRKSKIVIELPFDEWVNKATSSDFIHIIGVDISLVLEQRKLPYLFHADPADRLITTTALLMKIPLATFDQKIIQADCVPIWG